MLRGDRVSAAAGRARSPPAEPRVVSSAARRSRARCQAPIRTSVTGTSSASCTALLMPSSTTPSGEPGAALAPARALIWLASGPCSRLAPSRAETRRRAGQEHVAERQCVESSRCSSAGSSHVVGGAHGGDRSRASWSRSRPPRRGCRSVPLVSVVVASICCVPESQCASNFTVGTGRHRLGAVRHPHPVERGTPALSRAREPRPQVIGLGPPSLLGRRHRLRSRSCGVGAWTTIGGAGEDRRLDGLRSAEPAARSACGPAQEPAEQRPLQAVPAEPAARVTTTGGARRLTGGEPEVRSRPAGYRWGGRLDHDSAARSRPGAR